MSIIFIYSQPNNDGLIVKKISIAVSIVLLSTLLGACSGNNNGSSETGDSNGTTGTVVIPNTGSNTSSTNGTSGSGSTGMTGGGTSGGDSIGTGSSTGGATGTGTGTSGGGTTGGSTGTGTGSATGGGNGGTGFPAVFVKIGADGSELPADANTWSCILDTRTGLMWEVKTNDGGLRDKDWRYQHDGSSGLISAGTEYPCTGIYACNPISYIEALNTYGVCGKTDWRLPTDAQISGVGEPHSEPPHINVAAFPNFATDLPYCIAKSTPGNYQGIHFGVHIPAGAELLDALKVNMSDYDFQCRVLAVSY